MNKNLKRPSLYWMSIEDVKLVRDKISCLYLDPSDFVRAAPITSRKNGIEVAPCPVVIIHGGLFPCFSWNRNKMNFDAWLKVTKDRMPAWDLRTDGKDIIQLPFNSPECRIAADLVKAFSRYFPFIPTENFLQNNGGFIA